MLVCTSECNQCKNNGKHLLIGKNKAVKQNFQGNSSPWWTWSLQLQHLIYTKKTQNQNKTATTKKPKPQWTNKTQIKNIYTTCTSLFNLEWIITQHSYKHGGQYYDFLALSILLSSRGDLQHTIQELQNCFCVKTNGKLHKSQHCKLHFLPPLGHKT